MTLNLAEIEFSYDFFSTPLPSGNTLIMNKVSESLLTDEGEEAIIESINIIVSLADGTDNVYCSSVIGMENPYFVINTGYPEYSGKVLTADNMKYCTMEIKENE